MPRDGAYRIGDYHAAGIERIEIACDRCARRGSDSVEKALARWGDMKLPYLLTELTADCPHGKGADIYDRCGFLLKASF